ncbi:MAG TPA: hypothetical protein VJ890_02165 [Vineibacter sp.]|nr:hypothetical protein [Vineibacter sp.]
MTASASRLREADFAQLYSRFNAQVCAVDCGRKCAPLNGGTPVCCSTHDAVPVAHKAEFKLLKSRTDLWRRFKPYDAVSRKIVAELPASSCAVECKGAAFCERNNRSFACRSFPFFPYVTRERQIAGLTIYWIFENRCWMMSNLRLVETRFIAECLEAWDAIFAKDDEEWQTYVDYSAAMRRVFSRWRRPIPVLTRANRLLLVDPTSGETRPGGVHQYPKYGPFRSEAVYRRAIRDAGGTVPQSGLAPT